MNIKKTGIFLIICIWLLVFIMGKYINLRSHRGEDVDFWLGKLSNEDSAIKMGAVRMLGELGDTKASPYVVRLLSQNEDLWVRVEAVIALGRIKDKQTADVLIEALDSHNPPIRREAATSLGLIGDIRAVDPLISRLGRDNNPLVRARIIEALGMLKDKRAIDAILPYLKDKDIWNRQASHQALERLNNG